MQPSPCIGVCKLNADHMCVGCYRYAHEITFWRTMTDDERFAILQQLPHRSTHESHE